MSDDQERRITDCERRIEQLFGVTHTAAERIAVMESKIENVAQAIRESQKATNDRIIAMNADVKQNTETFHRRTIVTITVGLGALTLVVQVAGLLLN